MLTTLLRWNSRAREKVWPLLFFACASACGCNSPTTTSGFAYTGAIIRGQLSRGDGSSVMGSTVWVITERPLPGTACRNLAPGDGFTSSAVAGSDGRFAAQAQGLPVTDFLGCVSVHIRSPAGSGLADTAQHLLRVVMRPEARPSSFDTLSLGSVVLRAK